MSAVKVSILLANRSSKVAQHGAERSRFGVLSQSDSQAFLKWNENHVFAQRVLRN